MEFFTTGYLWGLIYCPVVGTVWLLEVVLYAYEYMELKIVRLIEESGCMRNKKCIYKYQILCT